jgi:hypothetical protein
MGLKIHAICMALNEEPFINGLLNSLYPFCSGISIITQYDRDFYYNPVIPDNTVNLVLNYPDPDGKIHLSVSRFNHEAAARNHEMLSILVNPIKNKLTPQHGVVMQKVQEFYSKPDYFLIVDADEIFDIQTLAKIIEYLENKKPRGMRITGYQYKYTWNQRIPISVVNHTHFGFVKSGLLFQHNRVITWDESRLNKLFTYINCPNLGTKLLGFISCPVDVGVFHHGAYLGGKERLYEKFRKHSHQDIIKTEGYLNKIDELPYDFIPTEDLPDNIRKGNWPANFFD